MQTSVIDNVALSVHCFRTTRVCPTERGMFCRSTNEAVRHRRKSISQWLRWILVVIRPTVEYRVRMLPAGSDVKNSAVAQCIPNC